MAQQGPIHIADADLGSHPEAHALNAAFRRDMPILKLCVEVNWEPKVPAAAVAALEAALLEVCPSLRNHQCRGDRTYRVLRSTNGKNKKVQRGEPPIEAPLALAHLLEHVVIDAISFITDEPVVSGATAALKDSLNQFDIFVESPDAAVASLTVGLARGWITAIVGGASPDGAGRMTLELSRQLYRSRPRPVEVCAIVRGLGCEANEVRSGLRWLVQHGLVRRTPHTVNFSGLSYFELSASGPVRIGTPSPGTVNH